MDELQILTTATEAFEEVVSELTERFTRAKATDSALFGAWTSELGPLNRVIFLSRKESEASQTPVEAALADVTFRGKLLEADTIYLNRLDPFREASSGQNIYELREYHFHPGQLERYAGLIEQGLAAREKYSSLVGWWRAATGARERVFLLWVYQDLAHRTATRKAANADPAWARCLKEVSPTIRTMTTTILRSMPISPLQ